MQANLWDIRASRSNENGVFRLDRMFTDVVLESIQSKQTLMNNYVNECMRDNLWDIGEKRSKCVSHFGCF